jgi:peptidoglycan/LPS O-acetylase OafA/YrhL
LPLLQQRGHAWLNRLVLLGTSSPASGERNFHQNYRADIDGLRALAILPVVGFHAAPGWFPGGFIGVDVFFVISGFLISRIIFESLDRSDFSFVEFYARRIRRIFPALLVVLAACFILGRRVLLGSELEMLGRHIAAGAGFVQNFVLWNEAGYFDVASELKPMLHLWSLAVEEQFYLAFPLLMWAAWRLRINLLIPVIVIFLASFAANLYGIRHDAVATFFAPQTRFWELMAGAILAWFARGDIAGGDVRRRVGYSAAVVDSIVSFVGLALVLLAIFGLDRSMPYPGVWALLPVVGTVLLIFSGPAASVNRLVLSNRFAIFVGRISYPLYLWHWPLLSFLTIINGGPPDGDQRFQAVLLSFVLAWLTFRFVERPVRESKRHRKLVTGNLVLGIGAMAVLGLNVDYFARIYDEPTRKIVQVWEFSNYPRPPDEHIDARYNLPTWGHNDKEKILIIGESHADQYINTIATALHKRAAKNETGAPEVMFSVALVFPPPITDQVLGDESIKTVVFSYFWALQYRSEKVNTPVRCCGSGLMGVIGVRTPPFTAEQMNELDAGLEKTVRALRKAGKRVYFILDNPFGEELSPRSLVKRGLFGGIEIVTNPPTLSRREAIQRDEPIRSRIVRIANETGADVIDPVAWLCDETCPAVAADGSPNYKDYDHLSLDALIHRVHYLDALVMPRGMDDAAKR